MSRSKGRVLQQVNKCSLPNSITSVIQEVNGTKRKITASKSTTLGKKSKQDLNYPNPRILRLANRDTRDEVITKNAEMSDDVPQTSPTIQNSSQQKDEPLKPEELNNIKKTIRNWKPPLLRNKLGANQMEKDTEKTKDAVNKPHQENKMVQKERKLVKNLLSTRGDGLQSGQIDLVGKYSTLREETLRSEPVAREESLQSKPVAIAMLDGDPDKEMVPFTPRESPMPLSPVTEDQGDDSTDDEIIIDNSQSEIKTSTNSSLKSKTSLKDAAIDFTHTSQIKGYHSENIDLFEGELEIYNETQDNGEIIDLTESQIQRTVAHDIGLSIMGQEQSNSQPSKPLKLLTLSKEKGNYTQISHKDKNNKSQLQWNDTLKEKQIRDVTNIMLTVPERVAICTPTNSIKLQDSTPPTIKRTPRNNPGYSDNASGREKSPMEVFDLTGSQFCTPVRTMKKNNTHYEESPTLFPNSDSDQDSEEITPRRNSQDGNKPPLSDGCANRENEGLDFYTGQVKSQIPFKIVDKFQTIDKLKDENGSIETECDGKSQLLSSSPKNMVAVNYVGPVSQYVESDNVHSQSKSCTSITNSASQKAQIGDVDSQSKDMNAVTRTDNVNQKPQKDYVNTQNKDIDITLFPCKASQKSPSKSQGKSILCCGSPMDNVHQISQNNVRAQSEGIVWASPMHKTSRKSQHDKVHSGSKSVSRVSPTDCASQKSQKDSGCPQNEDIDRASVPYEASQKSQIDLFDVSKRGHISPLQDSSQKSQNKSDNILVHNDEVHRQLTPHNEASQNSQNGSKNTSTPSKVNQNLHLAINIVQSFKNKHDDILPQDYKSSQNDRNKFKNTSTLTTEDHPSINSTRPIPETELVKIPTTSNGRKHTDDVLPSDHDDGSQTFQNISKNTNSSTQEENFPTKSTGRTLQSELLDTTVIRNDFKQNIGILSSDENNVTQSSKNISKDTGVTMKDVEEFTSCKKKDNHQIDKSEPEKTSITNDDVTGKKEPYFYEMDEDFDLFSSSQLLSIEAELKQEMLLESVSKSGHHTNKVQAAPRNGPMTCVPVFRVPTTPPLKPFDWAQKVQDDRLKLRSVVQEMMKLNAMITKVRREMWPRRRPDASSGRTPDEGMFPPPPPPPGAGPSGATWTLAPWGQGHGRY